MRSSCNVLEKGYSYVHGCCILYVVVVTSLHRLMPVSMFRCCVFRRQEQADLELAMRLQREEEERAVGLVV